MRPVIAASGRGGGRRGQQAPPPFREQNSQPKSTDSTCTTSHLNFYARALRALLLGAKLGCGPWINPSKGLALPSCNYSGEKRKRKTKSGRPTAQWQELWGSPHTYLWGASALRRQRQWKGRRQKCQAHNMCPKWPGGTRDPVGCQGAGPPPPCSSVGGGGP